MATAFPFRGLQVHNRLRLSILIKRIKCMCASREMELASTLPYYQLGHPSYLGCHKYARRHLLLARYLLECVKAKWDVLGAVVLHRTDDLALESH